MFIDDKLFDAIQYALNWGNNVTLDHDEYKDTYTLASELGRIKREQEKKSLQERFDQMEENISNHVITEATNQFISHVLPFLKKNNLGFLSGNGTWYICKSEEPIDHSELWEMEGYSDIHEILNFSCDLLKDKNLGSLMPIYHPPK